MAKNCLMGRNMDGTKALASVGARLFDILSWVGILRTWSKLSQHRFVNITIILDERFSTKAVRPDMLSRRASSKYQSVVWRSSFQRIDQPSACMSSSGVSGNIMLITWRHNLIVLVSMDLMSMITAAYCRSRASSAAILSAKGVSEATGVPARVGFGDANV